ncbi:MAG: class I SAM-dependent methyltransferase [Euryarchaeota archaeon]|nr:class I SAM-dependent methyltransferase [Euryarchaeota archaeon]
MSYTISMKKNNDASRKQILKTDEEWASQQVYQSETWRQDVTNLIDHPHRSLLLEKISAHAPVSSILEIGCGYGQNLYLLAKKYPNTEIVGIDINPIVVKKGNEWFQENGLSNVRLEVGRVQNLKKFNDKHFDIVLTDAILIYIKPDEIEPVLKEMLRVGKTLILCEWQCYNKFMARYMDIYYAFKLKYEAMKFSNDSISLIRSLFTPKSASLGLCTGHWTRDYQTLLKKIGFVKHITITKITKEYWNDKKWSTWGAIIEVDTK